ncbi:pilus assembly protein TadG-related protein [Mesorhizobium sp.]|uniref:pilus assembly protein TadG-related protein n=1 Tax=Mesorhizobium sp. TaxID=1871066 RepID=UPI002580C441|nr:pilus assembly protein TadG-related protein [Mesorhizobium sp.]
MLGDLTANFAVMTALCAPFALALAAFAIDEGSIYVERREGQAMTDLAAITAASNINNIEAAVVTTLGDNGMPGIVVQKAGQTITPAIGKTIVSVTPADIQQSRRSASTSASSRQNALQRRPCHAEKGSCPLFREFAYPYAGDRHPSRGQHSAAGDVLGRVQASQRQWRHPQRSSQQVPGRQHRAQRHGPQRSDRCRREPAFVHRCPCR